MQRLQQILTFTNVAAGGNAAAAHQLVVHSQDPTPPIPDIIAFDNAAFDFVSLVGNVLTVTNLAPTIESCHVWLLYFHTIDREYGNRQTTQLTPAPFIIRGGGIPQAGTPPQVFRRVIAQPADGSDFVVLLPVAMPDDEYSVFPTQAGVAAIVGIDCPDIAAGDRTTTQFRVVTTAPLANGDFVDFLVMAR